MLTAQNYKTEEESILLSNLKIMVLTAIGEASVKLGLPKALESSLNQNELTIKITFKPS